MLVDVIEEHVINQKEPLWNRKKRIQPKDCETSILKTTICQESSIV